MLRIFEEMKKVIFILLCLFGVGTSFGFEFPTLEIVHKDGKTTVVNAEGLSMRVVDNNLKLYTNQGEISLPYDELSTMAFSDKPASLSPCRVSKSAVDVYTPGGIYIGRYTTFEEAQKAIPAEGIYIFKSSDAIHKYILIK